jgi:hypothetical protein
MKGKDLQIAVNQSGIRIAELERRTGVKARTIYSLYDKDEVPQHYVEKLEQAGVKLQITTPPEKFDKALEAVTGSQAMTARALALVEETLTVIREDNTAIREDARVFREIVESAFKSGELTMVRKKTKTP